MLTNLPSFKSDRKELALNLEEVILDIMCID